MIIVGWFFLDFFFPPQNKCVPYWPELHSSKEVGPYIVTCDTEREAVDYKVRVLEISPMAKVTPKRTALMLTSIQEADFLYILSVSSHFQPQLSRTIWHYQYLSWPDHGVPQEPGGVLSFLIQVNGKQAEYPEAGPIIVHCRYFKSSPTKGTSFFFFMQNIYLLFDKALLS